MPKRKLIQIANNNIDSNKRKKLLDVPFIHQIPHSSECGLASVYMVLNYFDKNVKMEELREQLKISRRGTYAPQLGLNMLEKGLKVEMVTFNPRIFKLKDKGKSQRQILDHLKKMDISTLNAENKTARQYMIEFMEKGKGVVTPSIPSSKHIINAINNNSLIISLMTSCFLFNDVGGFNHHFNVIVGYDQKKNKVWVNDPESLYGGNKNLFFDMDEYLFGVHSSAYKCMDDASFLIVSKQE